MSNDALASTEVPDPITPDVVNSPLHVPTWEELPGFIKRLPRRSPWQKDRRMAGLRLNLENEYWYLNKRIGPVVLSERTPFKEHQKASARDYLMKRVLEEKARQRLMAVEGSPNLPAKTVRCKPEFSTWGDVIAQWEFRLQHDPSLDASTRSHRHFYAAGIRKAWKTANNFDLDSFPLSAASLEPCLIRWHGWMGANRSGDYANKCKSIWSVWFEIAIERGVRIENLAKNKLSWVKVRPKTLDLPSKELLTKLLAEVRRRHPAGADLLEGMVYTGLRRSEASQLRSWHVKLDVAHPHLSLPAEIVKGRRTARAIPLQPAAVVLFSRLIEASQTRDNYVFAVAVCKKPLKAACKALGIRPLSHHKFRHLFATFAYEQTGNASLAAKWLGHSDGGVLVHKTYNHVRFEYEMAEAKKLNFGIA